MKRARLEMQANRIEAVLASHKIPAQVCGGRVSPRYVRFHLATAAGVRLARIANLSEEIALALDARTCRVRRENGTLAVEVPLETERTVAFANVLRKVQRIPPCTALLGVDEGGHPLLIRLPSPEVAHILIAGTTGCGKTMLMQAMILSLALANRRSALQMALIDPKMRGFGALAGVPHLLSGVIHAPEEAAALLERLVAEMIRRDHERRSDPRVVVFIDELADLAQAESGRRCASLLTRLAQRGREAGIHLVVGTQKPSSEISGAMFKSNFPVRLVGRVTSADDARVAAGVGGSGAEKLLGRGDFLAVACGSVVHFQAPLLRPPELRHLLGHVQAGGQWPPLPPGAGSGAAAAGLPPRAGGPGAPPMRRQAAGESPWRD
ncbi:MAG: DNA translocase FtsK [Chloroflexi bacterium]|nr:DNA translocase FtsK [Chloroflexota bacterium]